METKRIQEIISHVWCKGKRVTVISTEEIEGEGAQLVRFECDYLDGEGNEIDVMECVAIAYDEGIVMTPTDWQRCGIEETTIDEIEDIDWMSSTGTPTFIINGLPRILY